MQQSDKLKSVSNVCLIFVYTTITMFQPMHQCPKKKAPWKLSACAADSQKLLV